MWIKLAWHERLAGLSQGSGHKCEEGWSAESTGGLFAARYVKMIPYQGDLMAKVVAQLQRVFLG